PWPGASSGCGVSRGGTACMTWTMLRLRGFVPFVLERNERTHHRTEMAGFAAAHILVFGGLEKARVRLPLAQDFAFGLAGELWMGEDLSGVVKHLAGIGLRLLHVDVLGVGFHDESTV